MPVLKVGESRWYEASLLKEADVLGAPAERIALGSGPSVASYEVRNIVDNSSSGIISITAAGKFVKVAGEYPGQSLVIVKAYYPDDPVSFQIHYAFFQVMAPGSPGDIFGADMTDAGAFTEPPE